MSLHQSKNFELNKFIPQEALSSLSETSVAGNALWSIQTNTTGVHFTLFWPTKISEEESLELDKLSGEEKRLITQSPALLSFILKRKKLESAINHENDDSKSDCSKPMVGQKRSRSNTPEGIENLNLEKIPKIEVFTSDSGLSSPNESKNSKNIIKEDEKGSQTTEEIKSNPEEETPSVHDQPCAQNLFNPAFSTFPHARPDIQQFLNNAAQKNPEFMQNHLFSGIQGQILNAAIQRRKQVEEEQKRVLQQTNPIHGINPAFRQTTQQPGLGQILAFPNNPPNPFGQLPGGSLDACRAIMNPQNHVSPTSLQFPNFMDTGLPREGEAVFRDKYIWSESVKKYLCSVCGYSTPYRSNIIVHLPKHYPELRRFRCPICNKRYGRKDLWKSHLRSRHPEVADFILTPSWHNVQKDGLKEPLKQGNN